MRDHCRTAEDVYQAAERTHRFRQRMYPRPKPKVFIRPKPKLPKPKPPPPPPLEPQPLIRNEYVTMRFIFDTVCKTQKIAQRWVLSGSRLYKHVDTRHLIAALIYILMPTRSSMQIGRFMHRDHSTIIHGFSLYRETLATYRNIDLSNYTLREIVIMVGRSMRDEAERKSRRIPIFLRTA